MLSLQLPQVPGQPPGPQHLLPLHLDRVRPGEPDVNCDALTPTLEVGPEDVTVALVSSPPLSEGN